MHFIKNLKKEVLSKNKLMQFYLFTFVILVFYLLLTNFFLKKFNFSLDKDAINEKHKSLLRKDSSTPLAGTFYFLPLIILLK